MGQKEADVGELQKRLLGMQAVIVGVLPSGPKGGRGGGVLALTETTVVCFSEQVQKNTLHNFLSKYLREPFSL